jgi:4-hydroxybenzoate polyprenyltransferase
VIGGLADFFAPARSRTWWEYKAAVFLGTAYLAAFVGDIAFSAAWPAFVACLIAIVPLASYVCVINDITDEGEDRKAGKSNTMEGKSRVFKASWVAACLLAGSASFLLFFRDNPPAALLYALNWIAFTAYSVPPFRLKVRGAAGVLADAFGGAALPALWCVLLADPRSQTPFLLAVAVWSFALGVRGILYHQAADFFADRAAGVNTFAARVGLENLQKLVRLVVLPIEIGALIALLWMGASVFVLPLIAAYLFAEFLLSKQCDNVSAAVVPQVGGRFALMKYYQLWLPITFILALSQHDLRYLLVLPVQLALFPDCWRRIGYHARQIWRTTTAKNATNS